MACIALFAPTMAMATTQLARAVRNEDIVSWRIDGNAERASLRMNWVVVTDDKGNRKICVQWIRQPEAVGRPASSQPVTVL